MAGKMSSYLQPSHPKEGEYYYADDHYYDDNDYSDERTIPRASSGLTQSVYFRIWIIWRDILSIIIDTTIIVVILWIFADTLYSIADFIWETSLSEYFQVCYVTPLPR